MQILQAQPKLENPGDQMMEQPAGESFTVCIECYPDGTFEVGIEPKESEGMEGQGEAAEDASEPSMRPARDVKEALTIALEIIKSGGKQAQAQADFSAGYDQTEAR